ncbi:pogo transposable element with ZNF domain isoform X2 [Phycodurus eques]|uniref:pogo transposable element with ZNF domain isoform X2 n=1 Tax=Phycodurus eques TaxID=693459 RepID=UPI002ACE219E|nr:pogo transposable element with ZNF domain isoform X2 [Phycodurus eques]
MDTELFMECEEEELEPWQQVDDGVDEDDGDEDNRDGDTCEPASLSSSSSLWKPLAPPLPPIAASPLVSQAPPLILTQTSGGAHLLLTTQAFPLPSPGPSLFVTLPQMPPPAVRPAVSSAFSRSHALSPAQLPLRASRGHQVNFHLPQPGDAKASDSSAPGCVSYSNATAAKVVLSVDEFYYGTAGGEQPLRRKYHQALKADTFSCNICERAVSDNLRLVQHTLQHSPLIRGGDDQKMCAFCFRQFSSGTHLQGHRERVHGPAPSSCTCRICEWAFDNESAFLNHMKANHKPGEMPYVCQVCFYRSSFYSDVLQHFASFHRDSRYLLCVFCLKVSRNVASYQKHVLRHQAGQAFHCSRCRLQFAFLADKKRHKLERHRSVRRPAKLDGLPLGSKVTIRMYGKRRLPVAAVGGGARLLQGPACLIQPIKIKAERQNGSPPPAEPPRSPPGGPARVQSSRLLCLECGGEVSDFSAHYPTHVRCLLCAFASCCSRAYAAHMIRHHVPHSEDQLLPLHRQPPPCPFFLLCSCCDFASVSGDKMAEHLLVNLEHRSATCRSRVYVEPDIQLCSDEETPRVVEADEPVQNEDWRLAASWKQPEDYPDAKACIPPFTQPCGPRQPLLKNGDAVDFFKLLFPAALVELITTETNAHAKTCRYLGSGCQDWVPVTPQEIKGFLGLCILMGLQNLPELSQYWSCNERDDGPTFQRTMSPERFKQLASNIRMGSFSADEYERGRKASDPLRVFRRMLDILSGAMWDAYRPNCCLTVDRALLPGLEGDLRTSNSKSQPQVWLLCDSKSGYCHRLFIQMGEKVSQEAGFDVVQELVKGLENKHHQIYMANSLISVPLVQKLLAQGIYASSSFPPPSRILPAALWEDGRLDKPGDFLQRRWGSLLATRWRDTKEMGCLSTNAHAGEADTVWRRSLTKVGGLDPMTRPMAFRLLQENMRGVDICKQLLACNPLGGILQDRHWRGLFWFLVNLSVVNAFIILRESRKGSPPAWVRDGLFTQVTFRRRLGIQLAECAQKLSEKSAVRWPKAERADQNVRRRHQMGKVGGCSKRCQHCDGNMDGAWGCVACGVGLCKEPRCFWEFHGLSPLNKGLTEVGFLENGQSGEAEPDKVHDHLAPLEDLDFSEDEGPDELEESECIKEEVPSPPSPHPTDLSSQAAAPVPKERVDFLSAHQLRVALLALCGGLRQASMVFATEPQLIRFWLKEARKHLKQKNRELEVRVQGGGEACLVAWVLSQREQQLPVSESVFFHKAATLNKNGELGDTFHMSYDWAVLFMLRYQLGPTPAGRKRTRARALPPSLQASVQSFKDFTQNVIRVHHLSDSSVAVMDELYFFVDLRSFQDRRHRAEALQFTGSVPLVTVCLSALADGTMLPALVLTNRQPIDEVLPDFVVLEVSSQNPSAEEAFKLWTQRIWLQYISGPVHHRKSMLVLDQHQDHVGDVSLSNLSGWGTLPAVIPEGCSFLLQPLDLGIKPALERFFRARWNKFSAGKPKEPEEVAPGQLQDSAAQMLIRWTVQALTRLKDLRQLWRTSFEITGILPKTDPGEEGLDREEKQQNLLEKLEDIMLPSEDRLDLLEVEDKEEDDDSEDDQKSEEKREENKEEGDPEEEDPEADTNMNREKNKEEDGQEGEKELGEDTEIDGGDQLMTMEEDSEEEVEKENEYRKEATKERRETRIMIGEEVGDEWKITMKTRTETRMEGSQTNQGKPQQMDQS